MEISNEDVERYLNRIFTGQDLVEIDGKIFLFKQPDNITKMEADLAYRKSYNRAVNDGILPLKDLEELIKKRNIFTEADEQEIAILNSRLEAQEILLSKTTKVKANQDRIIKIINELKEKINSIESKKTSKLVLSAEHKAEEERALYLFWACTYVKKDEEFIHYWPTFKSLLEETDSDDKNKIFIKFLQFKAGLPTSIIRYIARHSLWRIRYVTSIKVSEPLFGVPTSQYTNDMLNLAYWSNFYQNVYEMMPKDRPPDSIIEDDQALDSYMTEYYRERNREDTEERERSKFHARGGKLSAFDKEEVIVTKSNELYEDIKYDKPREAQMLRERADIRKKAKKKRR